MTERKPTVVMKATGRVKEYPPGTDMREILEDTYNEHQRAGGDWDRPVKLFVGGECIIDAGLADIAWEYGKFARAKDDEVEAALEEWIEQRFGRKVSA